MNRKITYLINQANSLYEAYTIGEETYSSKIDELIDELVAVKGNLKKGKNRKFFRKESSRIQSAIQTLRYLKRKSEREYMKKNDKILISESELIELVNNKGYVIVSEAQKAKSDLKGALRNLGSATDKMLGIYKRTTSGVEDYSTKSTIISLIINDINLTGQKNINIIETTKLGDAKPPSEDRILAPFKTNMFAITVFSNCVTYIRRIIATYDNGLFATSPTGTAPSAPPPAYQGVSNGYIDDKNKVVVSQAVENNLKNGGILPPLNDIIEGFNIMLRAIGDIPEDAGYRDGVYASTNIANDIVKIFRPFNIGLSGEKIKIEIMKNIQDKQSVPMGLTLDPDKKIQLKPGAMKELASKIVINLRDYIIDNLMLTKQTIKNTMGDLNVLVGKSTAGVHSFSDAPNFNLILSDIDNFVENLRSIDIK